MDTSDHGLSHTLKGPGAVANGFTGTKMRWWVLSSFSFEDEYTRGYKYPHRYKYIGLR
jgi:hypothetical protein